MNKTIEGLCKEAAYHAQQYEEKLAAANYLTNMYKEASEASDAYRLQQMIPGLDRSTALDMTSQGAGIPVDKGNVATLERVIPAGTSTAPKNNGPVSFAPPTAEEAPGWLVKAKNWMKANPYKSGAGAAGLAAIPAALYGLMGRRKPEPTMMQNIGNWISNNPGMAAGAGLLSAGALAAPFMMGGEKEGSFRGDFDSLTPNEKVAIYRELLANM